LQLRGTQRGAGGIPPSCVTTQPPRRTIGYGGEIVVERNPMARRDIHACGTYSSLVVS